MVTRLGNPRRHRRDRRDPPGLLRSRPGLISLAAAGLVIIMIGAKVTTLVTADVATALFPLVLGVLCAFDSYGRRRLTP